MRTRATIAIAGDVQEVGFRAFAMKFGQKMKLTGYAENMFDGTVQVVCEGEKSVIEEYIRKLKENDGLAKIENVDVKYSAASGEFKGFRLKTHPEEIAILVDTLKQSSVKIYGTPCGIDVQKKVVA